MKIPQIELANRYSISRMIKGGWQLSEGHSVKIDREKAISDMFKFVDAGITTFDCADIYINVEEMIGEFLKQYAIKCGRESTMTLKVHTKFVPDITTLTTMTKKDVRDVIERSSKRLGLERLHVVQFHWWDFDVPRYVEVANYLKELQSEGKIEHVSLTNFDVAHLRETIDSGVSIFSNQVQYSMLDHRPENGMIKFALENKINIFCYGTLAGGF